MDRTEDRDTYLRELSSEVLKAFRNISSAATMELDRSNYGSSSQESPMVYPNTESGLIGDAAVSHIRQKRRTLLEIIRREPAIARVKVRDNQGQIRTFYFCRNQPGLPSTNKYTLASEKSRVGSLSNARAGTTMAVELENGTRLTYEVLEHAILNPKHTGEQIDSIDSYISAEDLSPLTLESMIRLLSMPADEVDAADELRKLLEQERAEALIREGRSRKVLTDMNLRDQPILDEVQGAIFRLPINDSIMLSGPAGSGKTTTLIRRLGQKLSKERSYYTPEEASIVEVFEKDSDERFDQRWLMFAPTELLRLYVKEAFARENIPASDHHIYTWEDWRRRVARTKLGILAHAGSGGLILDEKLSYLTPGTLHRLDQVYTDYEAYDQAEYARAMERHISTALKYCSEKNWALLDDLRSIQNSDSSGWSALTLFKTKERHLLELNRILRARRQSNKKIIDGHLNFLIRRDSAFTDKLKEFLRDYVGLQESEELDDVDEGENEDEEAEQAESKYGNTHAAIAKFRSGLTAYARSFVLGRQLPRNSSARRLINWLDGQMPDSKALTKLGRQKLEIASLGQILNAERRLLGGASQRYIRFRNSRAKQGDWYKAGKIERRRISGLELDFLVLRMLNLGRWLLSQGYVKRALRDRRLEFLKSYESLSHSQVVADEATDFSPVQIACFNQLSHSAVSSIFMCGDFFQRITPWGCRSVKQLEWAVPGIYQREIERLYRQSSRLMRFSKAIISEGFNPDSEDFAPENDMDYAPVLAENMSSLEESTKWISERVLEVEGMVDEFPTIAVFVPNDSYVHEVTDYLNRFLDGANLQAMACPGGKTIGQDLDIRVFAVEHIKGLEFEGVFLLDVDRFHSIFGDALRNMLYVAATRAASFLGITSRESLPEILNPVRDHFIDHWSKR